MNGTNTFVVGNKLVTLINPPLSGDMLYDLAVAQRDIAYRAADIDGVDEIIVKWDEKRAPHMNLIYRDEESMLRAKGEI